MLRSRMVSFLLSFIRHGETASNKNRIVQGHLDVPLSAKGVQQGDLVAERLKNEVFTRIYTSDLARALQTADCIRKLNCSKGKLILDARLRERCYGIFEGKPFDELREEAARQKAAIPQFTPEGAETQDAVKARSLAFFRDLLKSIQEESKGKNQNELHENVLVVSHGGFIKETLQMLMTTDQFQCHNIDKSSATIISPNTGVTRMAVSFDEASSCDNCKVDLDFQLVHDKAHLINSGVGDLNSDGI